MEPSMTQEGNKRTLAAILSAGVLAANLLQWMLRSWSHNGVYVWDLVAAANATTPDLCEHQQVHVQVITKFRFTAIKTQAS
jgi:inosine-uridine nucleoside N-ribohydrolase